MTNGCKFEQIHSVDLNHCASQFENLFTHTDYKIVRQAIALALTERELQIVLLRFWGNELLEDIGAAMRLPVPVVENSLNNAFKKIKEFCFSSEDFSRKQNALADRNAA